jgi:hypothetical protein
MWLIYLYLFPSSFFYSSTNAADIRIPLYFFVLNYYSFRDNDQPWTTSGCIQKADCDSPGYADKATCCAAHFGGQTGGACSSSVMAMNAGKFYADYDTPWPAAGCKNIMPHPNYANVFYATQLA